MGFRSTGGGLAGTGLLTGPPSESIDIGDDARQGISDRVALIDHQHRFPPPAAAPPAVSAAGGPGASAQPARQDHGHGHTSAMHLAGGHADLSLSLGGIAFREPTGAIAAASTADVVVPIVPALPDANYTAEPSVEEASAGNTLEVLKIVSRAANQIVIRVRNNDALTARNGTLHVLIRHDSQNPAIPQYVLRASANLVFDGDSLTAGGSADPGQTYPAQVAAGLDGRASINNLAVGGQTLVGMESDAATEVDPLRDAARQSLLVAWGGTNDLYYGATAAVTYDRLVTYCTNRRAAGWKVVVLTLLPRSDAGVPATFDADRSTVNTSIRNNWGTFADALVDVAADARIGDAGDELDTTYYDSSKVHLNTVGYRVVAGLVRRALAQLGLVGAHSHDGVLAATRVTHVLPPAAWLKYSGNPSEVTVGNFGVWGLLDAEVGGIATVVNLPTDWRSFDVDLWWSCLDGAGNVYWRLDTHWLADGSNSLVGNNAGPPVIVTAPAGYYQKKTVVRSNVAINRMAPLRLGLLRLGDAADDTLPAAAHALAVVLRRAS